MKTKVEIQERIEKLKKFKMTCTASVTRTRYNMIIDNLKWVIEK